MNLVFVISVFLLVHILFDFYFQPSKWVEAKTSLGFKSKELYLHCFAYAVAISLVVLLLTRSCWLTVTSFFGVAIAHIITDGLKCKYSDNVAYFIADQIVHILVLGVFVWLVYVRYTIVVEMIWIKVLLIALGYMSILKPFGIVAKKIMDTFGFRPSENGLKKGGLWIGYIERFLIFTFILMSYYEGIGFLLTAKSIFRFGELKNEKEIKRTEYILIGTLLSFGLAICIGILTKAVLNNL